MDKLINFLDRCSQAYYAGHPIITDSQFDSLASSCDYTKVGAKTNANKTGKHHFKMYSLQKYYEGEDKLPLDPKLCAVTAKLDGAAISLYYELGYLVLALTRGDGVEGQDITDKVYSHTGLGIPKTIPQTISTQITGEIVAPKHVENSRNYASGSLNLKDVSEFATRAVEFFAYGVQPYIYQTYTRDLEELKAWGFHTIDEPELDKIFPSDGVVFRLNDNREFEQLGYTSKHPRGAYAQKERAEHVETTLLDVEWQVGKSGKVTPIAILEPVYIGDALVSRATLNNPGFIEQLDLQLGDRVAVIRAGEIIPCILHKVE